MGGVTWVGGRKANGVGGRRMRGVERGWGPGGTGYRMVLNRVYGFGAVLMFFDYLTTFVFFWGGTDLSGDPVLCTSRSAA